MLDKLKLILSIKDDTKGDLLTLLIEQAIEEALNYTHQDSIENLRSTIISMVVYKYNRLGTEGLDSEGYSGVSFGYSSDYPDSIMRALKSQRKLITV